ncbi:MAG: hypothetical protein ACXAEU_25175 [Candidatus Hodarchaeales archaeon]|jgi:hypothetical protein
MEIDMRLLFTIAVILHAIGHLGMSVHFTGLFEFSGFTNDSWLLVKQLKLSETIVRVLALLWILVGVGFLITAGGFWFDQDWWRPLAGIMTVLSIGLFVIWWNAFPMTVPIQANLGNVIAIAGFLWLP